MSVAFTREESAETAAEVELPDRPISPHANLVTASGPEALANAMAEYRAAYNAAHQIEDVTERRRACRSSRFIPLQRLQALDNFGRNAKAPRARSRCRSPPSSDPPRLICGAFRKSLAANFRFRSCCLRQGVRVRAEAVVLDRIAAVAHTH